MTRTSPRTNFHSSELIRCLSELSLADAVDHGAAFAEKLGQWIHFADAIALSAVHGEGIAGSPTPPSGARPAACTADAAAAAAEFDRVQHLLTDSIIRSCSPKPGKARNGWPAPEPEPPQNAAAAYPPYRRFYEAHQRDMEAHIQALRVNLRGALAKASPRLRKLAELDAMFEKILRERETKLLSKVPVLFKARFEQLFNEHHPSPADVQARQDGPAAMAPGAAWPARLRNDMQMLLLAELELRLQPATGLIEAFKQDTQ